MALKRGTSTGSNRYDRRRFVSEEAELKYNDNILKRRFIQERGFGECLVYFSAPINSRNWHKLCKSPESASLTLVREFYANLCEYNEEEGIVWVQGKWVSFSLEAINQFYELPKINNNELAQLLASDANLSVVERFFCNNDVTQDLNEGEQTFICTNALSGTAKIWLYCVCARLMPCLHTSRVFRDRAFLLYAILQDKTIDVGEVVYTSIVEAASKNKLALCCPHLITGLCVKAGIRLGPQEKLLEPASPLTRMTYDRLCRNKSRHETSEEPRTNNPPKRIEASSSRGARRSTQQVDDRLDRFIRYQVRCNEIFAKALNVNMDDFPKFDGDSSEESQ